MKYTVQRGKDALFFIQKTVSEKAELIGSLGKGKESNHDIDILIPKRKKTVRLRNHLKELLDAKKCVTTDWGGIYFYDTYFGDIDIHFTTKDFDY